MSSLDFSRNSTTVRSLFSGLQAFSPGLAAELAAVAMFRTSRKNPSEWEAGVSAGAERLSVDGPHGPLHVLRWGKGPLVVLVHGWNGRGSQLGAFVEPLVRTGLSVVAFDAPGHGDSRGHRLYLRDLADCIVDVARAVGPLHAIVAHSFGAAAVLLAHQRGAIDARRNVMLAPNVLIDDAVARFARA